VTTNGQKAAARICLFFAGLSFVFGWMVLCYCPGTFIGAAALSAVAVALGKDAVQITGVILLGASLLSASHMYLKDEQMKARAQQIQRNFPSPKNAID
jgi:hypothetical protein